MELKQKGENTSIDVKQQLTVTMKWTTAADFDLAAAYETKEGKQGLIYFGDTGNLDEFPYISLSGDEGVGDTGGDNEETMLINRLDNIVKLWLFCWDYGMVQKSEPARFKESDVKLTIKDESNNTISANIDTGDSGNVCCIATIDNSNPAEAKFINYSQVGLLKGLKKLDQLMNIVRQFVI